MMANPAVAVKELIITLGPLSPVQLQEKIEASFLPKEQWKKFWELARKSLKKDPLVVMPEKRTDPIKILQEERTIDDGWFNELAAERDMEEILERIDDLSACDNIKELLTKQSNAKVVADKILFVLKGARGTDWQFYVRALLAIKSLNISLENFSLEEATKLALSSSTLQQIVEKLSAKYLEAFFHLLYEVHQSAFIETMNNCLTELDTTAFNTYLSFAEAIGSKNVVMDRIAALIRTNVASPEIVCWLCKGTEARELSITNEELLRLGWNALETFSGTGARLKAKNQLKQLFESKEWLVKIFEGMEKSSIRDFMRSVQFAKKLNSNERSSLLAKIITIYPDLTDVLAEKKSDESVAQLRLTSIRSWKEKQRLLEKIINEDIPKNSQDIALARSYGDLRENFEYKSAKEMQGILMQRKAELSEDLAKVKATDFARVATDSVSPGVSVLLEQDGKIETYTILGEWDNDENLKIISNRSKIAQSLLGKKVGDVVQLSDEHGNLKEYTIKKIEPISEQIRQWIYS